VLALIVPAIVSAFPLPPTGTGTNHQFEFDGNLRTEFSQPGDLDWAPGDTAVTTLAAASTAGATNIKVVSVAGMAAGNTLVIDTGANKETRTIQTVGTAGSGGTGVTLTAALTLGHANGTTVTDSTTVQTAVIKGVTRDIPSGNNTSDCVGGTGSSLYKPVDPNVTPNAPQAPFVLGDGSAGQGVLVCDGTISKQTPSDTNGYVQGGHEDQGQNPVRWNIAAASSPKKTDLSEVYTYGMVYNSPFTPADNNADNLLMIFDAGRLDTNGDFHVDFEMNQKGINNCGDTKPPTSDANSSVCQPRTNGDMLVSYDSAGGGQPPIATVFAWKTTLDSGESCASSQGDINSPTDKGCYVQLTNPPSVNVGGTPYAGAAGVFNSSEIDAAPWRATVCDTTSIQNSSQCTIRDKVPANGNMEGYIDIAAFIPDFNLCPGFGEITARSRSSSGINASLQDTTGAIPVNASICGSIIVKKQDAGGTALPGATFTFSPDFLTRDANSTRAVADGGTLDHADTNNGYVCVDNVLFGSYDITETGVPSGYFGDTSTHTVAKSSPSTCADRLDANGVPKDANDVDTTFTNNLGSLLIKKVDGSGNLLSGATFTVTPDPSISSPGANKDFTDGGTGDQSSAGGVVCIDNVRNLGAGNDYTITEKTPPSGFFGDSSSITQGVHSASTCAARLNGDGTIKDQTVASTTLAAASAIGATNLKVVSVAGMAAGQVLSIDTGADLESRIISTVGTAGAAGTGVTLSNALSKAHASGAAVTTALPIAAFTNLKGSLVIRKTAKDKSCTAAGFRGQTAAPDCVGVGSALFTGAEFTIRPSPLSGAATTLAAASAVSDTNIKVASVAGLSAGQTLVIDTGNNQESGVISTVGTAGAGGTGVTLTAALTKAHASGATVVSSLDITDNGTNDAYSSQGGMVCIDNVVNLATVPSAATTYSVSEKSAHNAAYTKDSTTKTKTSASLSTDTCATRAANATPAGAKNVTPDVTTFVNTPLSKIEVIFTSSAGTGVTASTINCFPEGSTTAITPDAGGTTGIDQSYSGLAPNSDANHNYTCTINIDP